MQITVDKTKTMELGFSSIAAEAVGNMRQRICVPPSTSEEELNSALLRAASKGRDRLLNVLIDAGATNLVGAMTCAGWSGHIHVVDALVKRAESVAFGAAFVGALVGLRKEMLDHVVQIADAEGLDRCLLMGAARIWSCTSEEEVNFLLYALESVATAGARNFQRALQISCCDAVMEYWNGSLFDSKAKVLQRLIMLGSSRMTAEYFGRILLTICVTFLCKLLRNCSRGSLSSLSSNPTSSSSCSSSTTTDLLQWSSSSSSQNQQQPSSDLRLILPSLRKSQPSFPEEIVQDMLKVLSVVCKSGAAELISPRLMSLATSSSDDIESLLQVSPCHHHHHQQQQDCSKKKRQAGGSSSYSGSGGAGICASCSCQWPLKLMKYLLVECGIRHLSPTVIVLSVFQAARLNVLLPVVQCFLEHGDCVHASSAYLDMAVTFGQTAAIRYLLGVTPRVLTKAEITQVVRDAASNTRGPPRGPEGVLFVLHSNFLDDVEATLAEATALAELPETDCAVKKRLKEEWSQQAFEAGMRAGQLHLLNWVLVKERGRSCLRVGELPLEIQLAIVYLPLYKSCCRAPGCLLSQRQRGELVAAVSQLQQHGRGNKPSAVVSEASLLGADKLTLLRFLEDRLPDWCRDADHVRSKNDAESLGNLFHKV
ncbi:hypothetical protein CY35_11G054600 [Sphagnum magellanicum]|nr:hypothetical protein CY35_11G054600 [Sphagnum magellanicum]